MGSALGDGVGSPDGEGDGDGSGELTVDSGDGDGDGDGVAVGVGEGVCCGEGNGCCPVKEAGANRNNSARQNTKGDKTRKLFLKRIFNLSHLVHFNLGVKL